MTLVDSWLETEASAGRRPVDALADLNDECGTRYTHSHLSRWRNGVETPQPCARRYMLEVSLHRSLHQVLGIDASDDELAALTERITP